MSKEVYLADLFRQSAKVLTRNRAEWMGLLSSVAKYYKMSFVENVMVYVQRPDAGLIATKMAWEKKAGRYLKPGAKGIGVVDFGKPAVGIKYYFDFADTRGDYESFRAAMNLVWELERQYQPVILQYYHDKYGTDRKSVENCLCQLAAMQAEAFFHNFTPETNSKEEGNILYGMPQEAVLLEYKRLVLESAAFIILKKCGIDTGFLEENGAFDNIGHFNTTEMFVGIGHCASYLARPILKDIYKQIETVKDERGRRYEGTTVDGIDIQQRERRDAVSGPADREEFREREGANREVRSDVEGIYEGELSTEAGGTDGAWTGQRSNPPGGPGSGQEERGADGRTAGKITYAQYGGPVGEGRAFGSPGIAGGGDYSAGNGLPAEIIRITQANTEKETEGTLFPSVSFSVDGATANYHFRQEHDLYGGGPKEKCRNNIAAVRLMKQLEREGRGATDEEQIVLARFVGWGGLADALTPQKAGWEKEYEQIKEALTEEEFQAAEVSTLTSYYTDQMVITQMYRALERFGFRTGYILDPAMGTGNFFSVLPESMKDAALYGIELEPVAGGIAQKLYTDASIQIKGFEDTDFPDHFFDLVVGNIPFHSIHISDSRYDRYHFKIHEYFLAKSLDKVRPGGIVAVIASHFVMDKANSSTRKYLAQRAELMGAIRLPDNAFRRIAGTEATTDILLFQKREQEIIPDESNTPWLSIGQDENGVPYNSYFMNHPELVLGTMEKGMGMYGNEDSVFCKADPNKSLEELLEAALLSIQGIYAEPGRGREEEESVLENGIPAETDVKNYSYTVKDGRLYYREGSRMYRQDIGGKKEERIRGMIEIRTALREVIAYQLKETDGNVPFEKGLQEKLERLNLVYDSYILENGYLNAKANIHAFSQDADAPLLRSVEAEIRDEDGKTVKGEYCKTRIFFQATIKPRIFPTYADSAEEALKISMNVKGELDLSYMQFLYRKGGEGCSREEILEELGGRVYQDPDKYHADDPFSGWTLAEEYLSGHVKDKLALAILAADGEPERFTRNVEALKGVQPELLTPQDISFSLGSAWIPVKYYETFMYEKFRPMRYNQNHINIEFSEVTGSYHITGKSLEDGSVMAAGTYGTGRKNAYEILEASLNMRFVEVKDKQDYTDPQTGEDKVRYVLNRRETLLAREKQALIKQEFENWLFLDSERGKELTQLYNDRFNNIRPRTFSGDILMLPDMNETVTLRKHQKEVIAKGLYDTGNLLIAHEVGAGKTMSACVIAYERKRMGICNKPLIAVPNHTLGQWAAEFMRLYPHANLLVAQEKDFLAGNRRRFVSRAATGDWDCIIMPHSSFELINISGEKQMNTVKNELEQITEHIQAMKGEQGKSWTLKQMQVFKHNLQGRYEQLCNAKKKDNVLSFEEMGVDNLIVDEAHFYKNNYSYTKMCGVAGVGGQSSQRAMDMHLKCQYINEITNEHGVVYLTGTPVSNSMSVRP